MPDKSVALSVDVLSKEERKVICDALLLLKKSHERAATSARNKDMEVVASAFLMEAVTCGNLVIKFR